MPQIADSKNIEKFIVRPALGDGLGTVASATIAAENAI